MPENPTPENQMAENPMPEIPMADRSTPSFAEFVKRHRAMAGQSVHDQAEQAAMCTFDWVGATAAGLAECTVGVLHHHRDSAREHIPSAPAAPP